MSDKFMVRLHVPLSLSACMGSFVPWNASVSVKIIDNFTWNLWAVLLRSTSSGKIWTERFSSTPVFKLVH